MTQNISSAPVSVGDNASEREQDVFRRFPLLKEWTLDLRYRVATMQHHLRFTTYIPPRENHDLWRVVEVCRTALYRYQESVTAEIFKMPFSRRMEAFTLVDACEGRVIDECQKLSPFPKLGEVSSKVYALGPDLDNETWNKWIEELKKQETPNSHPSNFWKEDKLFNHTWDSEDDVSDAGSIESQASSKTGRSQQTGPSTGATSMLPQSTAPVTLAATTAASQQPTGAGPPPTAMSPGNQSM